MLHEGENLFRKQDLVNLGTATPATGTGPDSHQSLRGSRTVPQPASDGLAATFPFKEYGNLLLLIETYICTILTFPLGHFRRACNFHNTFPTERSRQNTGVLLLCDFLLPKMVKKTLSDNMSP